VKGISTSRPSFTIMNKIDMVQSYPMYKKATTIKATKCSKSKLPMDKFIPKTSQKRKSLPHTIK